MSAICSADDELESISSVGSDVGGQDDEQKMDPLAEYMYNNLYDDEGFHHSAFNYFSMLIGQMTDKHGNILENPPYSSTKKKEMVDAFCPSPKTLCAEVSQ